MGRHAHSGTYPAKLGDSHHPLEGAGAFGHVVEVETGPPTCTSWTRADHLANQQLITTSRSSTSRPGLRVHRARAPRASSRAVEGTDKPLHHGPSMAPPRCPAAADEVVDALLPRPDGALLKKAQTDGGAHAPLFLCARAVCPARRGVVTMVAANRRRGGGAFWTFRWSGGSPGRFPSIPTSASGFFVRPVSGEKRRRLGAGRPSGVHGTWCFRLPGHHWTGRSSRVGPTIFPKPERLLKIMAANDAGGRLLRDFRSTRSSTESA